MISFFISLSVTIGVAEREEDITYSEVKRPGGRASEQKDPGKGEMYLCYS